MTALAHRSLFLFVVLIPLCCPAAEIYVSPSGSDMNPGTKAAPLATLAAARDAARTIKKLGEPLTILLCGGTYYLPETLVLGPEDSGTQQGPIVYAACPGETVIVSGGQRLDLKWTEYLDLAKAR